MTIQDYETAIATFRQVLAGVAPGQITSATPCASFDVARSEQAAAFDRAAADAVAGLHRDGAIDKAVTLPSP